jgi:hypothetical protein
MANFHTVPTFKLTRAPRVDEFLSKHPRSTWATGEPTLAFPELKDYLSKYQDPQQADSILKIQKELDETKIVLHKTIESVLQRGEKIDDLVAKSDGLSAQSKMFYRESPLSLSDHRSIPCAIDRTMHFSNSVLDANRPGGRTSKETELVLCAHVVGPLCDRTCGYNTVNYLYSTRSKS